MLRHAQMARNQWRGDSALCSQGKGRCRSVGAADTRLVRFSSSSAEGGEAQHPGDGSPGDWPALLGARSE